MDDVTHNDGLRESRKMIEREIKGIRINFIR
jgi:hypothetical protein